MSHIVMESSLLAEMCQKCIKNIEYLRAWYYAEAMKHYIKQSKKPILWCPRKPKTYQQAYTYLSEGNDGFVMNDYYIVEKYWRVVEIAEKLLSLAHFGNPVTITDDDIIVLEFADMFELEDYQ